MNAIYDRNILDVQNAKELIKKILSVKFSGLSDAEKATWLSGLKGCLNYSDLNRIEGNCKTLSDIFGLGLTTKTTWVNGEFVKQDNFERIKNNVQAIRDTKFVYSITPTVPALPINRYDKLNDIEKILFDVYTLYTINSTNIDYIGELYDKTYELYDEADFIYWNNLRFFNYIDEVYIDEEIGVL